MTLDRPGTRQTYFTAPQLTRGGKNAQKLTVMRDTELVNWNSTLSRRRKPPSRKFS